MTFFKNKKNILCAAVGIILTVAVCTAAFSRSERPPVSETKFLLDTVCTITLYEWSDDENAIMDGAFDLCGRYDKLLSTTASDSDIYRMNHSHGKTVTVSEETAELIGRAVHYCSLSGGEFDITIYPVKALWDFSGDSPTLPNEDKLSKAVKRVDYRKIKVNGTDITVPDGVGIDLGAIAKGFIADRIADYLRSNHVVSAIIDLGGNVYAIGSKPDGGSWRVGIRQPFGSQEADVAEVKNASVVTSGIYQRYFELEGKIYHHILRSSDGMPCDTGLYSVTVISKNSEQCDALSTICMLLGYENSIPILDRFNDIKAVFITSDNRIIHYG